MGDKQGFLTKEGGSWKSWKKRYFVIKAGSLFYSKNQATGNLGTQMQFLRPALAGCRTARPL